MSTVLSLRRICKEFQRGQQSIVVLKDINLEIHAGEMVAIVGPSGSGKSTLLNIIGCLARPTRGNFEIFGREVGFLDIDELAALRREHLGFIFQQYHLMPELSALRNVEVPAVYLGLTSTEREHRAAALLGRLRLSERLSHVPGQLSGGQQQRVCICRALINGAGIILADEPTGSLDQASGEEVLQILEELNQDGKTIIIVTHDAKVASRAARIVELVDGCISSDRTRGPLIGSSVPVATRQLGRPWKEYLGRLKEAGATALISMKSHPARTFLTMLGIIIGIASVVGVVALGEGSRQKVLTNISGLGTSTLEIFPGKNFGDVRSAKITSLVLSDASAISEQSYVAGVTPTVSTTTTVRYGSLEATATVNGVGASYVDVKGLRLEQGTFFNGKSVQSFAQEVVIDQNTKTTLFQKEESPVGRVLLIGKVPFRIIGVTQKQQTGFGTSQSLSVYLPYTTVQARFLGSSSLRSITIRVRDDTATELAEQAAVHLLTKRHGTRDFFILNTDDIRQAITQTTRTLTILIASIAIISLVVGGVGLMNIMLVSIMERTPEIGLRMAMGARRSDIRNQFLIEAIFICMAGGALGIAAAFAAGTILNFFMSDFALIYSYTSIVAAVLCSTAIGVTFGYIPARNASLLDPVKAISRA